MNRWQRWVQAPATLPLRRVMFQIHLWLGISYGVYLLVISLSGSAIVLRPQLARWLVPSQVEVSGERPAEELIRAAVAAAYPDREVTRVMIPPRASGAVYVVLDTPGRAGARYFDPYRGRDLGPTYPWTVATIEWLTRLHDELLLGRKGVKVNGIGAVLLLAMLVSGGIIWWQGSRRWREGLLLRRKSPRSLLWQLHSLLGFWSFALMLIWALTAIYFAWPGPVEALIDAMDDDLQDFERPEGWLLALLDIHFGRFRGQLWLSVVWVVLGLIPAVMYISGFMLWLRGRRRGRQGGRGTQAQADPPAKPVSDPG